MRRPSFRNRSILALSAAVALSFAVPATAHADVDTDFANTLHTFGIYGQRDFNAWIAKISCERLQRGVDHDAYASQHFVANQLDRHSTEAQTWQFLGLAIATYCPDQLPVLQRASVNSGSAEIPG
ncbi:MAG: DUF732 domain-containing protein [Mycobacterium sp.]|nr:DUF732 domain-containing protein [Mycobacterium sp.]